MKRIKLDLSEEQAILIERALELYTRIGIGQFTVIKDHPTFEKHLYNACIPAKTPEIDDSTPQGKIIKIENGKALIDGSVDENGHWCKKQEWKDLVDVTLSTNYEIYHDLRKNADELLTFGRNILMRREGMSEGASWGIHNENVDESCRLAYDIQQVMRHERWKERKDKSMWTVDSSVHLTSKNGSGIKIESY